MTFILPNVSINGLSKVALNEIKILDGKINVISLVKERREFPVLTKNLRIKYPVKSELLSRIMYPRYARLLDISDQDVIIAHNIPSAVVANRLYKGRRLRYVVYVHDDHTSIHGTLPKFEKAEIKRSLNNAETILVNSKSTYVKLETTYGIKDGVVLYPGCSSSPQVIEGRDDFYLMVHMVSMSPNLQILYNLLTKNSKINIVVAGAKKYMWQAVYVKFKLKFGSRVKFVLDPTENVLDELYSHARMLLHTGIENFGMSPLEAAGYGTPSIAGRGSGVLEVLEEGKEIITFPENDADELNNLIRNYSHNSNKLMDIGKKAYEKAKKFNWNTHGQLLAKRINSIP
jgi:glycosyltransferase involved in cell wall biosynthesis